MQEVGEIDTRRLRTPGAARLVGLAPKTLERLRVVGGGPEFIKLGRVVIYEVSALEAWIKQRAYQGSGNRRSAIGE